MLGVLYQSQRSAAMAPEAPFKRPPFERGDVVQYTVEGDVTMQHWAYLNGRLGVVEQISVHRAATGELGAVVKWITKESYPDDGDQTPYPFDLLRRIGHIELPPPSGEENK